MTFVRSYEAFVSELGNADITPPILILRFHILATVAWEQGRVAARRLEQRCSAAFRAMQHKLLRAEDVVFHQKASSDYFIALRTKSRSGAAVISADARATLERCTQHLRSHLGFVAESGWIEPHAEMTPANLQELTHTALKRGARERERFAFFSTIGHELRTPLTSIRGYLETLLHEDLAPEMQRCFLDIAHTESLRVARLVEGMFTISLLDLGMHQPKVDRVSSELVLKTVYAATQELIRRHGITLIRDDACRATVFLAADHLALALINLIENAVKHGKPCGTVRVSTMRPSSRLLNIVVEDDGPGITPEDAERVFGLGERGTTSADGSGIGLALVRMLIERNGGTVTLRRSALGGCAFSLDLPGE